MEAKVKTAAKKVSTGTNSLKSSLDKKNHRLVKKYILQLKENLEELDRVCISAEIEGVNKDESYLSNAIQLSDNANDLLIEGDIYLLDVEENEEARALHKVTAAKVDELFSLLTSFGECLAIPVGDLDTGISKLIEKRKGQMKEYEEQKILIASEIPKDKLDSIQELEKLYRSTVHSFESWLESAVRLTGVRESTQSKSFEKNKGPGLKLDRLALPVFRGNIRGFAKFVKEFDNTVGVQYPDPKIKVMYLQSQCLNKPPKKLVHKLNDYDEVLSRLKERYGKPSLVIDCVLKEVNELKLSHTDEQNSIIKLCKVLQSAWDDLSAVNCIDEFCNVVTLSTLESKLPHRLQTLWAREKIQSNLSSSNACMIALKAFLEEHRKIASDVLLMRGKGELELSKPIQSESKFQKFMEQLDSLNLQISLEEQLGLLNLRISQKELLDLLTLRISQEVLLGFLLTEGVSGVVSKTTGQRNVGSRALSNVGNVIALDTLKMLVKHLRKEVIVFKSAE
jgi:hypothetical protein